MKKRKIFKVLIIFVIIIVVSAGCENTDIKPQEIGEKFYVLIDYSALQEVYNEGFPKDLKAKAFLGKKELNNNVTFSWSSNIDGDITEGKVISTESLSIGEHSITLIAYSNDGKTASETVKIIKVRNPKRRQIKQKAALPRRVTDRTDGTVYVDNRDGTITDTATRLMWELSDDGYRKNVYAAHQYCEDLNLAGYGDWRMAKISELEEIANIGLHKKEPIICEVFDTKNSSYWTQTKSSFTLSNYPDRDYYKAVEFSFSRDRNGLIGRTINTADEYSERFVRCVR